MREHLSLLLAGVAAVLTGCSFAPTYVRPELPTPAAWPTGPAYPATPAPATPTDTQVPGWRLFLPDTKLQGLVERALENNRDLRLAGLNVERARALYGIQRAEALPAVSLGASGSLQRLPADLSNGGGRQTVERYDVNLGVASWEIDFFGRIRSLKDRAMQEYLATTQARRSSEILLVSAVANAYLALAADRDNLKLAQTTLEAQQGALQLVRRRFEQGLAPELDTFRAQTQVESARGDVARFTQMAAQDQNALALLLGSPVPDDLLPADLTSITPPQEIGAGLPSDVLLRRPDVLQAENLLRAAHADIGAARAAFFPRISLTAAAGTASSDLTGLFSSDSGAWSYAPRLVLPVFDARVWSAYRAAKVQRQIALTQFERTVQVAFRDVADALAQRGTVGSQVAAQQALVQAVAETHRLATSRYEKGIDSYLGVLDAQRSLYSAQQVLVYLRLAQYSNLLTLYRVVGGW